MLSECLLEERRDFVDKLLKGRKIIFLSTFFASKREQALVLVLKML